MRSLAKLYQNPGSYSIRVRQSGKCIDVPGGQSSDGVLMQQFSCHGGLNQLWRLAL
jgi:hypothetical protein